MELKTETQKVKLVEENQTGSLADGRVAISYMLPSIRHESCFTVTNGQAANGLGEKCVTQVTSIEWRTPANTEWTSVVEEIPLDGIT